MEKPRAIRTPTQQDGLASTIVVLVICSDIGKVNATSVATSCKLSFTQIGLALLVGICGVAPQTSDQKEIILGDVIVSEQIVAYDFGRRSPDEMKLKENLQPKSHTIRRFTKTVQTHVYDEWIREQALEHLRTAQETYPNKYNSPQRSEDKIFPADYRHKHQRARGVSNLSEVYSTFETSLWVSIGLHM